jgi:hypothetical protein
MQVGLNNLFQNWVSLDKKVKLNTQQTHGCATVCFKKLTKRTHIAERTGVVVPFFRVLEFLIIIISINSNFETNIDFLE